MGHLTMKKICMYLYKNMLCNAVIVIWWIGIEPKNVQIFYIKFSLKFHALQFKYLNNTYWKLEFRIALLLKFFYR